MRKAKHILKSRLTIIALGLMVGMAILGQPIAEQYCQEEADRVEQNSTDKENDAPQEVVSSLEAVAPAQQAPTPTTHYFVLDEIFQIDTEDLSSEFVFFENITDKLIRVLFQFIIAPNAP